MTGNKETRRRRGEGDETLTIEERRARSLEDMADSLRSIRSAFADISIWVAHIGRNMPTGRKH